MILSVGENGTRRYQLNIWSSWRGWRGKGEGREEGARRVDFQFGAILFVGDRWVLAVQKKRVFYVDMRVNDDCFVHSDVIGTGQHSCGFSRWRRRCPRLRLASPLPPLLAFCLSRSAASCFCQQTRWRLKGKGPFDDAAAISLPVRAGVHSFAYALYVSFYISRYK